MAGDHQDSRTFKPSAKRIAVGFVVIFSGSFLMVLIKDLENFKTAFLFVSLFLSFLMLFFIQFVRITHEHLIVERIWSICFWHLFATKIKLNEITKLKANDEKHIGPWLSAGDYITIKTASAEMQISNFFFKKKVRDELFEALSSKVEKDCLIKDLYNWKRQS